MHTSLPLSTIGINALAAATVSGSDPWLATRFPHQTITSDFITRRAAQGASRPRLAELVRMSMSTVTLSPAQEAALLELRSQHSVCVVAGQQIGLFGGPLYTLLKIRSAVALAAELHDAHAVPVIPVFWLEDNDHDAAEASTAVLLRADGSARTTTLVADAQRRPVHDLVFSEHDVAEITEALAELSGQFADEVRASLAAAYAVGGTWNDAFLSVLQPFLAEWGVLVIRGSDVVRSGMHMPLVERDLAHPGVVRAMVELASRDLVEHGYHAQATANDYSFFVHVNGERQRIESTPTLDNTFSPGVLVRPIVQDAIIPSVASVLGAAEIAYHAQLIETYQWFGVTMPAIVLRHTATIVDAKTERLLQKSGTTADFYMRPWADVERDVVARMDDGIIPNEEVIGPLLAALLDPLRQAASTVDASLVGSVESTGAGITKNIEALQGKLRSALKRTHAEAMDRHRTLARTLWPDGAPQERVVALATWVARLGTEKLRSIVDEVCTTDRTSHTIVS